jgi:hypothetical protein
VKSRAFSQLTTIAALALVSAAARAESTPTPTHKPVPRATPAPNVQLASAERGGTAQSDKPSATTAAKKPAGRVTTCRCGDQISDPSADPDQD